MPEATSAQLDLLAAIHSRSPEGLGVPEDELRPLGFADFDVDLVALEAVGLVVNVDSREGEPDSVALTDEGKRLVEASTS